MAELLDPDPGNPTPQSSVRNVVYSSIDSSPSASKANSAVRISPIELPRPGYSYPHQHRIIPPSIKGHGRLIIAHRAVPYWVGVVLVIGAFAWAVWCAFFVYPLLGGHPNDWKSGIGKGQS